MTLNELNPKKYKDEVTKIKKEIKEIKNRLSEEYGNYFTDNSPLWNSTKNNGIMTLPEWQGGKIKVIIKRILNESKYTCN